MNNPLDAQTGKSGWQVEFGLSYRCNECGRIGVKLGHRGRLVRCAGSDKKGGQCRKLHEGEPTMVRRRKENVA